MAWIDAHALHMLLWGMAVAACGLWLYAGRAPAAQPGLGRGTHALLLAGLLAGFALWIMVAGMRHGVAACALCARWDTADRAIAAWLAQHLPQAWRMPLLWWTQLGHVATMAALGVAVGLWLAWRRAFFLLSVWSAGALGIGLWIRALKTMVGRERPALGWVAETGYSFPSGHSAGSLVIYGLLAWLLAMHLQGGKRLAVVLLAVALALGIGVSRVLLRVHYASDVLAGWLLAVAWLALVIGAAQWARQRTTAPTSPAH